ncbi:alkaline phosphatase D family protein [Hyalangium sp.]|uniref:alkaline phosphatase D family protein n=1 Tax=Hyalangium sp. TaxID=2028555 RepID=UPI002D37A3AC|nr:alkaline phosphatase D family protein [Hyalangium sp.]HYH98174.1 alkaline phosphatase D family protein [Hyalangium sp.]
MAIEFPVKPVTVGPIVGHTTATTVRLWGRGSTPPPLGGLQCYGVAQLLEAGSTTPAQARYFKLLPEDDYTGSVDFAGLAPGRTYAYRMGYFFSGRELLQLQPPTGLELQGASASVFRTVGAPGSPALSLVVGSCRHPTPGLEELVNTGLPDRGDRIFRTILDQVEGGMPTDLLMMAGDQIYADMGASSQSFAQYCASYQRSFTQPNLRRLMSRVPTYMTLDDHEIADNWSMDRLNDPRLGDKELAANKRRFMAALEAYRCYQVVHGPALQRRNEPGLTNALTRYWYTFEAGPARFFVLDVRTERYHRAQPPELIGARQLHALREWMQADRGGLKFVVSAVPFFPDLTLAGWALGERNDKWAGFQLQRQKLLDFMRDEGVHRTVFLSGDVHVSLWSELKSTSRPDFRVHSIISSAFNAPALSAPEFLFELEGLLDGQTDYTLTRHGGYTQVSNFTRLTWKEPTLRVEIFDRKGKRLHETSLNLDG